MQRPLCDAENQTLNSGEMCIRDSPDTIAGSNTCLYDCMKRAVLEMNVPLESAVRAASETPAKSLSLIHI